jgi:ABC-type glycerol-3-phosphate transport system substrate-binding protein
MSIFVEVYRMKRIIGLALLITVLATACSGAAATQEEGLVTVYKLPT